MNSAMKFIILMGLVSLFGDVTYEGARSIVGPYLATFGLTALMVGLVTGFGEFVGYGLRLISGFVADRTGRYWFITFLGYFLILCIPLLAFAQSWWIAALLIVVERLGKAIRTPARDAMLSFATKKVGRGMGFGIHEFLDQVGAIIGPLIVFSALAGYGYREAFMVLFLPALFALLTLLGTWKLYPAPQKFEKEKQEGIEKSFWLYSTFVFLSVLGFLSFPLLSYHLASRVDLKLIPLLYALAMGVDALFALISGRCYDKIGLKTLIIVPVLTPAVLLAFHPYGVFVGVAAWGAVMGAHEAITRAAVADLTGVKKRSTAYGIFNAVFGVAMFAGGAVLGFLYDISMTFLVLFVLAAEIAALLILLAILK
uniref:MFS transporter n=1 Tax=Archaeoglobus fulgidus TaxID=2234 RepID=A0A7C3RMV7_ARCFL